MSTPKNSIVGHVTAFARRKKAFLRTKAAIESTLVILSGGALLTSADFLFQFTAATRGLLILAVYALASILFYLRGIHPSLSLRHIPTAARDLEKVANGFFQESVISALELQSAPPPGVSPWMIGQVTQAAADKLQAHGPSRWVSFQPVRQRLLLLATPALAVIVLCFFPVTRSYLTRAFIPFSELESPHSPFLSIQPGHREIVPGSDLTITVKTKHAMQNLRLLLDWDDGIRESLLTNPDGTNTFSFTLPHVEKQVRYRLASARHQSAHYHITLLSTPALESVNLEIIPPRYLSKPPVIVAGGNAELLQGGTVQGRLQFRTRSVRSARLVNSSGLDLPLSRTNDTFSFSLRPSRSLDYRVQVDDLMGHTLLLNSNFFIKVLPDHPPRVTLSSHDLGDGLVARNELIPLHTQATDDFGLARVALITTLESGAEFRRQLSLPKTNGPVTTLLRNLALDLSTLGPAIGDRFQLSLEATDLAGQKTRSAPLALIVAQDNAGQTRRLALRMRQHLKTLFAAGLQLDQAHQQVSSLQNSPGTPRAEKIATGELLLLQKRAAGLRDTLTRCGAQIRADSAEFSHPLLPSLQAFGVSLEDWADGHFAILAEAIEPLFQAATPTPDLKALDLSLAGRDQFSRLQRTFTILVDQLESELLLLQAEAAQTRYKRMLPMVRGALAWHVTPGFQPGLNTTFFNTPNLTGSTLLETLGVPRINNLNLPSHGSFNFSARFAGEIFLPIRTNWTFTCEADDSVQLRIDSQDLFPPQSWSQQTRATHTRTLPLEAGWHPIQLNYSQAAGDSLLRFLVHPENQPPEELPPRRYRSKPTTPVASAGREMSDLPADVLNQIRQRLQFSFVSLTNVPVEIGKFGEELDARFLADLALLRDPNARQVAQFMETTAAWQPSTLAFTEGHGDLLVDGARQAKNFIDTLARQAPLYKLEPPSALSRVQGAQERVREQLKDLREARYQPITPSQETERLRVAATAAEAWSRELKKAIEQTRPAFRAQALAAEATLPERTAAMATSHALQKETEQPLQELLKKAREPNLTAPDRANRMQAALDQVNRAVAQAGTPEKLRQQAETTRAAQAALQALEHPPGPSSQPAPELKHLETTLKNQGNFAQADRLEKTSNPAELKSALQALALAPKPESTPLQDIIPEQLLRESALLKQDKNPRATADRLADTELNLALEAERKLDKQESLPSLAYSGLERDLNQTRANPQELTPKKLEELANRANALTGKNGDPARQAELAAAAKNSPPPGTAPDDLAKLAESLNSPNPTQEQQQKALEQLQQLANQPGENLDSNPEAEARQQALQNTAGAAAAQQGDEKERRQEFARREEKIAADLNAITREGQELLQKTSSPEIKNALQKLQQSAPPAGDQAAELGRAARANPAPSTSALASRAENSADQLQRQAAQPLAEAFQALPANTPAAEARSLAKLGERIANAVAEQRQAAQDLNQSLADRDAADQALAETNAAAQLEISPVPESNPALEKATAAQQSANQAQALADTAQQDLKNAIAAKAPSPAVEEALSRAAQAELNAANLQGAALKQQLASLSAGEPVPLLPTLKNLQQARSNSQRQQRDSLFDLGQNQKSVPARQSLTQAERNLELARQALEQAESAAQKQNDALQQQNASLPVPSRDPNSQAARNALAKLGKNPSPQDRQEAAKALAQATQKNRLRSLSLRHQEGQRSSQSSSGLLAKTRDSNPDPGNLPAHAGKAPPGIDQADWARLPENIRNSIRNVGLENFSPDQQAAIRAYFRQLSATPAR